MGHFARRLPIIFALILQAFIPNHSYATDLNDTPMAVSNSVKPNVMVTLDDSGSMQWEIIPESPLANYVFPRPTKIYTMTWSGIDDQITVGFDGTGTSKEAKFARFYRTAKFNKLYYDPTKRYTPGVDSNNATYPNSVHTAAYNNPYQTSTTYTNPTTRALTTDTTESAYWYDSTKDSSQGTTAFTSKTFYPATYFIYTGSTPFTDESDPTDAQNVEANFTKVEIKSSVTSYTKYTNRTDCAGTSCTFDEEALNFANWYSYYRSRILAAQTGVGKAIARQQDGTLRVGLAKLHNNASTVDGWETNRVIYQGVRSLSSTLPSGYTSTNNYRYNFFNTFYNTFVPLGGTPTRKALDDVGQYFKRTGTGSPWCDDPSGTCGSEHYCRQNYNILVTDGMWNGAAAGTSGVDSNIDGTSGPTITGTNSRTYTYPASNPHSDTCSSTVADVAAYYWKNDLRTDLTNGLSTTTKDPAFWQHLVNFTVGFGLTGYKTKAQIDNAFLANDSTNTATINSIDWSSPQCAATNVSNITTAKEKIDDLAHAALNSRGQYFIANDADDLANSLTTAFNDVLDRDGAASAVAVANSNVSGGDNDSYASSYNSGSWTGDLQKYLINIDTGQPSTTGSWTTSAQAQLQSKTSSTRYIVTYTGTTGSGQGRPFQATGCATASDCITATQQARLATPYSPPGTSDGAAVLAYLRGVRTGEENGIYRTRSFLLGDIVNAEPTIIRNPLANYADTCYKNTSAGKCDTSFKDTQASRTKMVAQGANDGFLHMFDASSGSETWAYLPNLLISMSDPAYSSTSTLNMLSRRSGYTHKYFVDGTPVVGDADFSNTNGISGNPDPDWRTILVGGLGKGGRGYYALDVTSPSATSEANAAAKVLWEFPNSSTSATIKANIGYSYGKPIITKTAAYGWVVLVTSGYNNGTGTDNSGGDGHGYLWVLNARTGDVLQTIDTGVGSAAAPSGLAHIAAWTDNGDIDNTVTYAYGGDLLGNLWRFDLTDDTGGIVYTKQRLATLRTDTTTSSTTNFQAITTVPELASININGVEKRFIYVGTGKYLGSTDVDNNQTQSVYGLIDDLSTPASTDVITDPVRSNLVAQTLSTSGATRVATTNTIDFTTKKGWYIDLPGCAVGSCTKGSERVNTDPALALGMLIFTSNIPNSTDPCSPGGSSFLNAIDYKTGGAITGSSWASISLGNVLASRPVIIKLPSGSVKALVRTSDANTQKIDLPTPPSTATPKRVTWRELTE